MIHNTQQANCTFVDKCFSPVPAYITIVKLTPRDWAGVWQMPSSTLSPPITNNYKKLDLLQPNTRFTDALSSITSDALFPTSPSGWFNCTNMDKEIHHPNTVCVCSFPSHVWIATAWTAFPTWLLGGYPDTTTKTLKHRGTKEKETWLSLWMTETIVRLRKRELKGFVYISVVNPLTFPSRGMLT